VIHCHSFLSHDSRGTFSEISDAARRVGIDFIVMTDHQSDVSVQRGMRGFRGDTLFMVGSEIRAGGASVLAFPLTSPVNKGADLPALLDEVRRQGGLAFAAHCESFRAFDEPGLTGIEILNLHADVAEESRVGVLLRALALTPGAFFASVVDRPAGNLGHADAVLRKRRCTLIAGNDAHSNIHAFGVLGGTIGTYEQLFRTVSTHVLATALDQDSIVEALQEGRCYVAVEIYRDATGFSFLARNARGDRPTAMMGEEVPLEPGLLLEARTPAPARIELLRDGQRVAAAEGERLRHEVVAPGVYRIEAELDGRPWIYGNPIYVTGQ
jgi:hypothetical protein